MNTNLVQSNTIKIPSFIKMGGRDYKVDPDNLQKSICALREKHPEEEPVLEIPVDIFNSSQN